MCSTVFALCAFAFDLTLRNENSYSDVSEFVYFIVCIELLFFPSLHRQQNYITYKYTQCMNFRTTTATNHCSHCLFARACTLRHSHIPKTMGIISECDERMKFKHRIYTPREHRTQWNERTRAGESELFLFGSMRACVLFSFHSPIVVHHFYALFTFLAALESQSAGTTHRK